MKNYTFNLTTADHLKLHGQGWEAEAGSKAVICLVHGIGEHSDRYEHVAKALNRTGYAVISMDLRGHGNSDGKRGHTPNYESLMDDISLLLETAHERYPELPVFFYGHSLGGNLVLYYALSRNPTLAGIISSSPALRLSNNPPAWKTAILHLMYALRINCCVPRGMDDKTLSHDLNVIRKKRNDPLFHGLITPQLAIEMLRGGLWCLEHAAELPCPLLLMHGEADQITSAEASREFAASAGDLCTLKTWEGFYHELHNERENAIVLETIQDWLNSKTPA